MVKQGIEYELESLRLCLGDVLIVRVSNDLSPEDGQALMQMVEGPIRKMGIKTALVITRDVQIEAVSEEAMNKAGWYKKEEEEDDE